jgi:hypothetical protein
MCLTELSSSAALDAEGNGLSRRTWRVGPLTQCTQMLTFTRRWRSTFWRKWTLLPARGLHRKDNVRGSGATPRLSPAPPQDPVASTPVSRAYLGAVGSRVSREKDEVGMTVTSQHTGTPHSMPEEEATETVPESGFTSGSRQHGGFQAPPGGATKRPPLASPVVLFRCNS